MTTLKPDVLFMSEHEPEFIARLEQTYTLHIPPEQEGAARDAFFDEIIDRVRALVMIAHFAPSRDLLRRMTALEAVYYLGAGYQNLDLDTCREMGVKVAFSPGANSESMGDFALALMLACVRRLLPADRFVRDGRWGPEFSTPMTETLYGKTVGIIGLGNAGLATAKRAEGFGTTIIYHKPTPRPDVGYRYYASLMEMAGDADLLVVACPGTEETRDLVDGEVLEALGPDGYLINIARGSVVASEALLAALKSGVIAGAGLDVFEGEPNLPPELFEMDNVVLSPHRAGVTRQAVRVQWDMAMASLEAHFAGKPMLTPVPEFP